MILLSKIFRIHRERDAMAMLVLERKVDGACRPPKNNPEILPLIREFGHDAVRAALFDVQLIRHATDVSIFDKVEQHV